MKTFLATLILFFTSFHFSFCQNYLPIFKDSISWNIHAFALNFSQGGTIDRTKVFNSDTSTIVIQDKKYRILSRNTEYFFREDTLSQKIYVTTLSDPKEYLVYDFSIDSIGDLFTPPVFFDGKFSNDWPTYIVTKIDTVFQNGVNRKRIQMKTDEWCEQKCPDWIVWLEGVGSEYSINYFDQYMNWSFLDGPRHSVICMFRDTNKIYSSNNQDICWIESSSTNELHEVIDMNIYPNPVSDIIKIEFELTKGDIFKIEIMDILGKPIETITDGSLIRRGFHDFEINTSNWSSGTYFIVIRHTNGRFSEKIIRK